MNMNLDNLLAQWDSNVGKPFKGSLIDMDAHKVDPGNPGCMCAQGQVLHYMGGYTADELAELEQVKADKATAKLLGISRTHAVLLRNINDSSDGAPSVVLTHPERIIGDQAATILAFWHHIDRMTGEQWSQAHAATAAAGYAAGYAARDAARDAARETARVAAWDAAGYATMEIMGANVMRAKGQSFFFLPMFGFEGPEDIK